VRNSKGGWMVKQRVGGHMHQKEKKIVKLGGQGGRPEKRQNQYRRKVNLNNGKRKIGRKQV